jgi:iron(III) transport system ATP-binding protein
VMNHGVIDQVGMPLEIYRAPATPFVADFVGSMTFLDAEVAGADRLRIGTLEICCADAARFSQGTAVRLGLRPEEVRVRNLDASTPNTIDATVAGLDFLGAFCRAQLRPAAAPEVTILADFSANLMRDLAVSQGQRLTVSLPPDSLRVFTRS